MIHITLKLEKTGEVVENKLACRIREDEDKETVAKEMLFYFAEENKINPDYLIYEIN